jgi:hypothetical protein
MQSSGWSCICFMNQRIMFFRRSRRRRKEHPYVKFVLGFFIGCGAVFLLFWNEGRAVKTAKSLHEGENIVISVSAETAESANDGKLVHVMGQAYTPLETVQDPELMLSFTDVLRLKREVEMYQWDRSSSSDKGKTTTYTYKQVWEDRWIDPKNFPAEYTNPPFLVDKKTITADVIKVGVFEITHDLSRQIKPTQRLLLSEAHIEQLPASVREKAMLVQGGLYVAYQGIPDPAAPEIGDMKIRFYAAKPTVVSVIAKQQGDQLVPYITKAGNALAMLKTGSYTADQMFAQAVQQNTFTTWLLRVFGFGLMFLAFRFMFGVLLGSFRSIPFLGRFFDFVSLGGSILSILLAAMLSLLTISIAWLFYRPLVAIGILVIVVAMAFLAKKYFTKRAEQARQQKLEIDILKLAARKGGKLTDTEVAIEYSVDIETAKRALESLARQNMRDIDLAVTDAGLLVYTFYNIEHLAEKHSAKEILEP